MWLLGVRPNGLAQPGVPPSCSRPALSRLGGAFLLLTSSSCTRPRETPTFQPLYSRSYVGLAPLQKPWSGKKLIKPKPKLRTRDAAVAGSVACLLWG